MEHSSRRYYERRIRKKAGQAIKDYGMIHDGDRVVVAISGGMDSLVLLKILCDLRLAAPIAFELIPVHISTGYEHNFEKTAQWVSEETGLDTTIIDSRISEILQSSGDPDKSPCALCSRIRRGHLYCFAQETGASSIALGHHMDDIVETFFLRTMFTGQIGAMAPSRQSNDGKNRVIRPLAYCTRQMVEGLFGFMEIEPVDYTCPVRPDSKRRIVREHIAAMEKHAPKMKFSVFASLSNIDMKSMCSRGI